MTGSRALDHQSQLPYDDYRHTCPQSHAEKQTVSPSTKEHVALVTPFSYANMIGLVPTLASAHSEAREIQVTQLYVTSILPASVTIIVYVILAFCCTQAILPCKYLDHPDLDEFASALAGCEAWFFIGKGCTTVSIVR